MAVALAVADGDGSGEASDKDDELPDLSACTLCFGGVAASLLARPGEANSLLGSHSLKQCCCYEAITLHGM